MAVVDRSVGSDNLFTFALFASYWRLPGGVDAGALSVQELLFMRVQQMALVEKAIRVIGLEHWGRVRAVVRIHEVVFLHRN